MSETEEILKIIEKDARATPQQISTMTGVSLAEVKKIIKKAEEDRVIVKYKTMIDWNRAGTEQVLALIEVKVKPERDKGFDRIAERICRFPQARSVYLVSGTYDLAVLVTGDTMHEVAEFTSQKLASLESVEGTVTHFMLKRLKEDGEILGDGEECKRLPLTL